MTKSDIAHAEKIELEHIAQRAIAALSQGRADLALPHVEQLLKILPSNAMVQMLAQKTAVMAFNWPAVREVFIPAARNYPDPAQIDLIAFHAQTNRPLSGVHQPIDYLAVLQLSFESAALRSPGARRILLTDKHTRIPEDIGVDEVIRFELDLEKLMYERMRVQHLYLETRAPDRCTVFMDSDIVINQNPAEIFAQDFDIGLTWRTEFPDAPFNGGLILVGPGNAGLRFFHETLRCYDALAASEVLAAHFTRGLKGWWGDQFALAVMAGYREFAEREEDCALINQIKVQYFSCSEYNFTVESVSSNNLSALASKRFLHFKGNRKSMQAEYLKLMRNGDL